MAAKKPTSTGTKQAAKAPAKKPSATKAPAKASGEPKTPAKPKPAANLVAPASAATPAPAPPKKYTRKSLRKDSADANAAPAAEAKPKVPVKNPHPPAFIKKQHQRLLDLRDDLVDAMSGMTRDTIRNAPEGSEASGSGMHQGDAGSDAYDRDFALSVLAKEQDALYEIEEALRRVKQGTYGICEMSGEKIPVPRLEAIPFARLTVQCQSQWEKDYGNRRFRPSNEVGFSGGNTLDEEDSDAVSLDEDDE